MKDQKSLITLTVLVILAGLPFPVRAATAQMNAGDIRAIIADNQSYGSVHKGGYNGLAELYHGSLQRNIFDSRYAGLNFEFIVSGDSNSFGWHIFEPRKSPITLTELSDTTVRLSQARTQNWPLQTTITFTLNSNNAIDFTITAKPLADAWSKYGYIGMFFASYIDSPEDKGINFIGRSRPGKGDQTPRWIKHSSPGHATQAIHRPAGSTWDPVTDPGFPIPLVTGVSDYEYIYPFYYGLSHGKMYLIMFKKPTGEDEIRFGHSPTGAGPTNPAWDFFCIKRDYKVGEPFTFEGRLIYWDTDSKENIIKEYENWSGDKVNLGVKTGIKGFPEVFKWCDISQNITTRYQLYNLHGIIKRKTIGLSSGFYIRRMEASGNERIKKVLIVR
jgi:hypothetical protein